MLPLAVSGCFCPCLPPSSPAARYIRFIKYSLAVFLPALGNASISSSTSSSSAAAPASPSATDSPRLGRRLAAPLSVAVASAPSPRFADGELLEPPAWPPPPAALSLPWIALPTLAFDVPSPRMACSDRAASSSAGSSPQRPESIPAATLLFVKRAPVRCGGGAGPASPPSGHRGTWGAGIAAASRSAPALGFSTLPCPSRGLLRPGSTALSLPFRLACPRPSRSPACSASLARSAARSILAWRHSRKRSL